MTLPAAAAAASLNHLLQQSPWAAERLRAHAGKRVRLALPLAPVTLEIAEGGAVHPAPAGAEADVELDLGPGLLLRLAAGDAQATAETPVRGDSALAQEMLFLFRNLRWDAEDDLARLVGDVTAHRLAQGAHRVREWQARSAQDLAQMAGEYLTDEAALLPTRDEVEQFLAAVDTLRDDAARLEKRIERLGQRD